MTLANDEPISSLRGVLLLGVLLALAVPATAHAQRRDDEARALYSAGEIAFGEGRYEYALVHFQRAYELSPRPILLFNIGASAERLSRDTLALEAYEQYLQELPDAPNRRVVAARIVLLRQALYGQPAQPLETEPPTSTVAPWVVVGVGASAVVLGAVFTGLGFADAATVRDLPDGTPWAAVADEYERAPRRQLAGLALLGVGTVAVVTGVVLALTGRRRSSSAPPAESTRVTPWVEPHSAGLIASGSF